MKIQLDTKAKTIKVEEKVNLGEFIEAVQRLLPDGVWKEFSLEANTVIHNWSYPIVIKDYQPYYPWWHQPVTYTTSAEAVMSFNSDRLVQGTYNIDL
jgi:hypothetical protein